MSLSAALWGLVDEIGNELADGARGLSQAIGATVATLSGPPPQQIDRRDTVQVTTAPGLTFCETCRHLQHKSNKTVFTVAALRRSARHGCTLCQLLLRGCLLQLGDIRSHETVELWPDFGQKTVLLMFDERMRNNKAEGPVWKLSFSFPDDAQLPITSFLSNKDIRDYADSRSMSDLLGLVDECDKNHRCLLGRKPKLPTRVIFVGSDSTDQLRLVCPPREERAPYTILSHCWGGATPLLTNSSTLQSRMRGFALTDMSKTFRDAVVVTRRLNIRYLWIDSLCIVQEDRADWESESPKMSDYYSLAYLTIAAARASDSEHGFLLPVESPRVQVIGCEGQGRRFDCVIQEAHNTRETAEVQNRLYTRAWVFQEMVVSPRVISFGAKELEWYCRERGWCECLSRVPEVCRPDVSHSSHWQECRRRYDPDHHMDWLQVVNEFTRRDLTRQSDRLPAISALASRMGEKINVPYLAGIWQVEPSIWDGLQWRVPSAGLGTKQQPPRPPSWSWASVCGKILYNGESGKSSGVTFLGAKTHLQGDSRFGEAIGGSMTVRGPLLRARLDVRPQPGENWAGRVEYDLSMLSNGRERLRGVTGSIDRDRNLRRSEPPVRFSPDTPLELEQLPGSSGPRGLTFKRCTEPPTSTVTAMSGVVYCLRFVTHHEYDADSIGIWVIVLRRLDGHSRKFSRIGLAYIDMLDRNDKFFREVDPKTITIV